MKILANKKLAVRIGIITTAITLGGMFLLWGIVSVNAAAMVRDDITNQMIDGVESRAAILNKYVTTAEEYMTAFSLGREVRELLMDPDDPLLAAKAQEYTEDFAEIKGVFEGLYIADTDTHVLTHSERDAVGMTTRQGESLKNFQDTILAREELTNLGIMKSPGTGSMILSMYYPIYEGGQCLGFVGAGVYARYLTDALLNLNMRGLPESEYIFLNAETGVYLYHEDEALLNTVTEDTGCLEIIQRIREEGDTQADTLTYRDENGVKQVVAYKYLQDRSWVFMIRDRASQVYSAVTTVRIVVGILCAIVAVAIIMITLLMLRREGRELMAVESAIGHLRDLNLSADRELEVFYGRSDEIGMIAETTHEVCIILRKTIDDVGRVLGEIAAGNLSADVMPNEAYYIGDFRVLSDSLKSIRENLVDVIRDISQVASQVDTGVASQVDTGADRVSAGAQALSQGTAAQAESIDGLVSNVTSITSQIHTSAERCGSASGLVDQAAGYAAEADGTMERWNDGTVDRSNTEYRPFVG